MKWNIFSTRNQEENKDVVEHTSKSNTKTNLPFTIQQIHDDFDSQVFDTIELISAMADVEIDENIVKLESLGFYRAKNVSIHSDTKKRKDTLDEIRLIIEKYPYYKFIQGHQVEKLCKKYGLLCGGIDRYIGEVPSKNAREIIEFENTIGAKERVEYMNRCDQQIKELRRAGISEEYIWSITQDNERSGNLYKICAPASEMSQYGANVVGHEIIDIKDPIVLFEVNHGYLIVSKWGLEGEDASLTNEKMN